MTFEVDNRISPKSGLNIQSQRGKKPEFEIQINNENEKPLDLMLIPEVDPDRFFKLMDSSIQGLRQYKLIAAAFELGVFKALRTPMSAEALANKLGSNPALMPAFFKALFELGLLDIIDEPRANQEIIYELSELSAIYLLEGSPFFQQHYFADRLKKMSSAGSDYFK